MFRLGEVDLALTRGLFRFLELSATPDRPVGTAVQAPRGRHDLAILLAILCQLARLYAKLRQPQLRAPFLGSVVVVGMDTALQRRLSGVSVRGVELGEGLRVQRVRRDGWIVDTNGHASRFRPNQHEALYLNTRVGWPTLPGEHNGLVIVDSTSFASRVILERALDWAKEHRASRYVVLTNRGDWKAETELQRYVREKPTTVALPDYDAVRVSPEGRPFAPVALSTNRLLRRPPLRVDIAPVQYAPVEQLFFDVSMRLREAWRIEAPAPFSVLAAGRLVTLLRQALGTIEAFDRAAAQDHRARTITSLVRDLELTTGLDGPWRSFRQTHWPTLQYAARRLAEEIRKENPKHWATVLTVDHVRRRFPDHRVFIRTANTAAAFALEEDLASYDSHLLSAPGVRVIPRSLRLPWTDLDTVEILPALPARSRQDALWSAEATWRLVVTYGWESEWVKRVLHLEAERVDEVVERAKRVLGIALPVPHVPEPRTVLEAPDPHVPGETTTYDPLAIDLDSLSVPTEELRIGSQCFGSRPGLEGERMGRPVYLDDRRVVWWVSLDHQVETLIGARYRTVLASDLTSGDLVILPRGTGREDLFTRLAAAKHRDSDVLDLTAVLRRWWHACRTALALFDHDETRASRALVDAGCSVTTQLRAWADGSTLAPQDGRDIARVARLVGDEWLEDNWRRVAAIATELRGLHIRIGQRISGAMREASTGDGPNLRALAEVLGTDPGEILDEFDLSIVSAVGEPDLIPATLIGTVQPLRRPIE